MLPDYPATKKYLQKKFTATIRKETKKDPFIGMIQFRESYEGNTFRFTTNDGFFQKGGYKEISTKFEISKDEIVEKGPDAYFSRVPQIAKDWIELETRLLIQKMDEVTRKTGNIVNGKSKPLSPELILDALDKVAISFDEFGNANIPALVVHPDNFEKMKKEFKKYESDPLFMIKYKLLYKLIIDKKRREWLDRESDRKLVD
jgi:hypothetical protein